MAPHKELFGFDSIWSKIILWMTWTTNLCIKNSGSEIGNCGIIFFLRGYAPCGTGILDIKQPKFNFLHENMRRCQFKSVGTPNPLEFVLMN